MNEIWDRLRSPTFEDRFDVIVELLALFIFSPVWIPVFILAWLIAPKKAE